MKFNKILDERVVVVFTRPGTHTTTGGFDCSFRVALAVSHLQVADGYQGVCIQGRYGENIICSMHSGLLKALYIE